jgi:RNA polymerase sigma factor (sigma-70 family)
MHNPNRRTPMKKMEKFELYTDEDFDRLWDEHVAFVATRLRHFNIPISDHDAWQEARIAMLKALRRYDPSRNVKFISVYGVYLDNALRDYLRCKHTIVYPRYGYRLKNKPPMPNVISLETIIRPRDSGPSEALVDMLVDSSNAYRALDIESIRNNIMSMIRSVLTDRELFILESYYGLNGEQLNLREIGERIGLSREAVRQQLNKTKRKLRQQLLSNTQFQDLLDTYLHDKYLDEEEPRCAIPSRSLSMS